MTSYPKLFIALSYFVVKNVCLNMEKILYYYLNYEISNSSIEINFSILEDFFQWLFSDLFNTNMITRLKYKFYKEMVLPWVNKDLSSFISEVTDPSIQDSSIRILRFKRRICGNIVNELLFPDLSSQVIKVRNLFWNIKNWKGNMKLISLNFYNKILKLLIILLGWFKDWSKIILKNHKSQYKWF